MAIDLDSGNGVFDMLGAIFAAQDAIDAFRNGALVSEVQDALALMDGATPSVELRAVWDGLPDAVLGAQDGLSSMMSSLQQVAADTIIQLADEDDPLPERSLYEGMFELIQQMGAGSKTVDANEPGYSLTYSASLTGTTDKGRAAVSLLDGRGRSLQFAYAEVVDAICTTVSNGEATFDAKGEEAADPMAHNWPAGSGAGLSLVAFEAGEVNNLIPNGTLDAFTTNVPDGFTATAGAAGTDFSEELTTVFVAGGSSLEIAAGGVSVALLSTDSLALESHRVYALGFWYRKVGTVSGGSIDLSLYDGAANINDEAGNANAVSVGFGGITTDWQLGVAFFRLPDPLPATIKLRIRTATALSGGGTVYLDHIFLGECEQLYEGGPYLAIFAGAAPFELDDVVTIDVSNDYRGEFQTKFHRNFDMVGLDLILPSATGAGENILDDLVA